MRHVQTRLNQRAHCSRHLARDVGSIVIVAHECARIDVSAEPLGSRERNQNGARRLSQCAEVRVERPSRSLSRRMIAMSRTALRCPVHAATRSTARTAASPDCHGVP